MILQLAILFSYLAIGELIVYLTDLPIPSSIIGMILLTASLHYRIVKIEQVAGMADFLVKNIGFFFVPAGVGVMRCLGLISEQWLPIVAASIGSTLLIIATTGWVHQITRRMMRRRHHAR